jgi:hypothetical protein
MKKNIITYKYVRPTHTEYGHTKVFVNGSSVGYFIPDRSPFRTEGHNWVYLSDKQKDVVQIYKSNRKELINEIMKRYGCI